MDMEEFYQRQKNHGLPLSCQYAESPEISTQSPLRILPFDNFPRTVSDQRFIATPSGTNSISSNYNLTSSFPMSQPPQSYEAWNDPNQTSAGFADHSTGSNGYYDSASYITANEHDTIYPRTIYLADIPRSCEPYNPRLVQDNSMAIDSFEPSAYMMDSNKPNHQAPWDSRVGTDFNSMDNNIRDFPQSSISRSPVVKHEYTNVDRLSFDKPHPFRMPSSETSEDGVNSSREMTAVEIEDQGADEPYAKLIYRALMSAPNHSMVLQEIYQWFRDNTIKGSSDTKGWMNSIRHNLSMNAAFKKTERKLSGDETKKSTEWVLEEFAIKDGVQSTTRYRKGNANKKFIRSATPAPNRQSSGRKGGLSASRGSRVKQRRDDRPDPRLRIPRIDTTRRTQFPHQARSQLSQRQRSPLTPPNQESLASSPYFYPKLEQFEMPYDGMYGLEDVQGVHTDDSPVFSGGQEMHFFGHRGMGNQDHQF